MKIDFSSHIQWLKEYRARANVESAYEISKAIEELEGYEDSSSWIQIARILNEASRRLRYVEGLPPLDQQQIQEFAAGLAQMAEKAEAVEESMRALTHGIKR